MPASAHDVAAALRQRVPGLTKKKLHKLLYYCQGHHLATFGEPLFGESLSAWDMGPVVGALWKAEDAEGPRRPRGRLAERQLNTIGYVVSRYGSLTGRDLEILSHHEDPWRRADAGREPGGTARIDQSWLAEWFSSVDDDPSRGPERALVSRRLADAAERAQHPLPEDDRVALRAYLDS